MSTILRYKMVVTRKPHICSGCGRQFKPPAKMIAAACADNGRVDSYYLCETCDTITRDMDCDDEFGFGDLREEALFFENKSMGKESEEK